MKHFGFRLSRNPTEVDFSPGFRDAFLLSGDAQVNVEAANPKPEIATAIVNSEGGTLQLSERGHFLKLEGAVSTFAFLSSVCDWPPTGSAPP